MSTSVAAKRLHTKGKGIDGFIKIWFWCGAGMMGRMAPSSRAENPCYVSTLFCLYRMSQKVVDGLGWNLVDSLDVGQGRINTILVKIRIYIR